MCDALYGIGGGGLLCVRSHGWYTETHMVMESVSCVVTERAIVMALLWCMVGHSFRPYSEMFVALS